MKICVAQIKPVRGDIERNVINHLKLIALALVHKADTIIFPELSITGYEPALAKKLATNKDDKRFNIFQFISNDNKVTIGIGVPIKSGEGINISMILFQPNTERQIYSKRYLHADEEPFFVSGQSDVRFADDKVKIALAICYEISVEEHAANAFKSGADIYIASVAKSAEGVEKAFGNLSGIAAKYSMKVLMSNCTGYCDDFECGGKTSVWNNKGVLARQLNCEDEGFLILDTDTEEVIEGIL